MFCYSVLSNCLQPMDCSPPGSSVHGIRQARMLEWVAIPFFKGIFPTQGSNLHLLHWQAKSLPQAIFEVPVTGIQAVKNFETHVTKKKHKQGLLKELMNRNMTSAFTTRRDHLQQLLFSYQEKRHRDFPGDPVVGTPHFHCQGPGSIPDRGTKISHAIQHNQKEKNDKDSYWAYFKGKNASFSKVTGILIEEKIYVNKMWLFVSTLWSPEIVLYPS